jgi:hypothetical protein
MEIRDTGDDHDHALAADPWRDNELSRRRQLREDASRPLAVNLAEGLALSEFLATFTGSARRPRDRDDVEALEAGHAGEER